ncbi:PEGA domain-containing protein [Pontiellaceae bacterium B12227]|nr:PEGA domain-containing protein [Pontiellaceae bacterium B12227]
MMSLKYFIKSMVGVAGLVSLLSLSGCGMEAPQKGKGSISVESNPERAELFINGSSKGITPVTIQGLPSSTYIVELRKEGYERTFNTVNLLEGQEEKLKIQMNRLSGLLLVESNPSGADVMIDGVSKGNTPVLLTDLPLGSYNLEFRSETQLPRIMTAELKDRTPVGIFAELISNTALLDVNSTPEGAEVRVNGLLVGKTPLHLEEVLAGQSEVKIAKRGYTPYMVTLEFEATKPYQLNAELEALPSGLTIITSPEGAKVSVDNEPVGEAPVTVSDLKGGPHEITASLNGYATKTKTIFLEPDINDIVEFNMVKNSGTLVLDTEPANVQVFLNGKLLTTTQPKGGSDTLSQPVRITLKSGVDHTIQLVREGFVSGSATFQIEVDEIVTRHEVLKRIFVFDTRITTQDSIIDCRFIQQLPNGNIRYEYRPGIYDEIHKSEVVRYESINLNDEANRDARRLIERNREAIPTGE